MKAGSHSSKELYKKSKSWVKLYCASQLATSGCLSLFQQQRQPDISAAPILFLGPLVYIA